MLNIVEVADQIQALGRMKEVSEMIREALIDIPDTLASTDRVVALYQSYGRSQDSALHGRSASLLASVLALLNRILQHVYQSRTSR